MASRVDYLLVAAIVFVIPQCVVVAAEPAALVVSVKNDESGSFVQPDYERWEKVKVGMTEKEVIAILGPPLHDEKSEEGFLAKQAEFAKEPNCYMLSRSLYGWLHFSDPAVPHTFEFEIAYREDKVDSILSPFEGNLSKDGHPTAISLLTPLDKTSMDFYPRYLDLRWTPASGKYPMEYQIEVDWRGSSEAPIESVRNDPAAEYHEHLRETVRTLHYADCFVGRGAGRWRVRAKNGLGEGEWSEYRYFEFKR